LRIGANDVGKLPLLIPSKTEPLRKARDKIQARRRRTSEKCVRERERERERERRERRERAPLRPGAQTADPGIDLSP